MSLKGRRFSLDSSGCLEGLEHHGGRRGSNRFSNKKSRQSHSLDDARLKIQELNHSLNNNNNNISLRQQTIAEHHEPSDGLINNSSFRKHNKTFHKLFPEIPEEENVTHTFTCALQKEVLYHGKLFVSENHVCFHSSVLLKDTKVVIPASSVREVKKHNSALSMLSIQTADEKYSFVSLRNREMCSRLLHTICCHAQVFTLSFFHSPQTEAVFTCVTCVSACVCLRQAVSSPHMSSAENEADHDVPSSYSSLEDCPDHVLNRQNSIYLDHGFPDMSSDAPARSSSTHQSSLTDEDSRDAAWIWSLIERVTSFFLLRDIRNLSLLFYLYIMLMVLLLVMSGYIGLRIQALEEQLNSLGALSELALEHKQFHET
ncbi:uncharacterized protein V6R79_017556 [Siganus canaliculatus]